MTPSQPASQLCECGRECCLHVPSDIYMLMCVYLYISLSLYIYIYIYIKTSTHVHVAWYMQSIARTSPNYLPSEPRRHMHEGVVRRLNREVFEIADDIEVQLAIIVIFLYTESEGTASASLVYWLARGAT